MALNDTEILLIADLIDKLIKESCRRIKAASLGYPDLLLSRSHIMQLIGPERSEKITIRDDSEEVAKSHCKSILSQGIAASYDLFQFLRWLVIVFDCKARTGTGVVADLNQPLPEEFHKKFDLVIDPGTLEHVFNIGTAMKNISEIIRPGGYVYHQNPLSHCNQGFYNLSPTSYADYYDKNGFIIEYLKYFDESKDEYGLEVNLKDKNNRMSWSMSIRRPFPVS